MQTKHGQDSRHILLAEDTKVKFHVRENQEHARYCIYIYNYIYIMYISSINFDSGRTKGHLIKYMKAGDAGFAADLEQNHGNLNGEHTGK